MLSVTKNLFLNLAVEWVIFLQVHLSINQLQTKVSIFRGACVKNGSVLLRMHFFLHFLFSFSLSSTLSLSHSKCLVMLCDLVHLYILLMRIQPLPFVIGSGLHPKVITQTFFTVEKAGEWMSVAYSRHFVLQEAVILPACAAKQHEEVCFPHVLFSSLAAHSSESSAMLPKCLAGLRNQWHQSFSFSRDFTTLMGKIRSLTFPRYCESTLRIADPVAVLYRSL